MTKFKIGDRVKRIKGEHSGMKIGDEDIVMDIAPGGSVKLRKYHIGAHADYNLELCNHIATMKELLE